MKTIVLSNVLKDLIDVCSKETTRYALKGVLVDIVAGKSASYAATDGRTLISVDAKPLIGVDEDTRLIIPATAIKALKIPKPPVKRRDVVELIIDRGIYSLKYGAITVQFSPR